MSRTGYCLHRNSVYAALPKGSINQTGWANQTTGVKAFTIYTVMQISLLNHGQSLLLDSYVVKKILRSDHNRASFDWLNCAFWFIESLESRCSSAPENFSRLFCVNGLGKRAYCPNLYTVKVWMAFLGGQRIFYVKPRLVVDKTPWIVIVFPWSRSSSILVDIFSLNTMAKVLTRGRP